MRKLLRWLGIALAVLIRLLLVALAYVYLASGQVLEPHYDPVAVNLPPTQRRRTRDAPRRARILGMRQLSSGGAERRPDVPGFGCRRDLGAEPYAGCAEATDQQLAPRFSRASAMTGAGCS